MRMTTIKNNQIIPPSNPLLQHQQLQEEIESSVIQVLRKGNYILGEEVAAFEKEAADYLGVKSTLACASGTDALLLSLVALGVKAGDEIITTSFSFISVVEVACYLGAIPVLVDIDEKTFNLDTKRVRDAISEKTVAIIPVHLYGQCAQMEELKAIASEHNLFLIEDSAQAFGSEYKKKKAGSLADFGSFSFYPTKNLSCCGDGGLISLPDDSLLEELKSLRNHGSLQRYTYNRIGYNSRLDEIQAAILRIKLRHLDRWNKKRQEIASIYDSLLQGKVVIPFRDKDCNHIFHQYTILTEKRDKVALALKEENILSAIYYPYPLHCQPSLKNKCKKFDCPNTEKVIQHCLSLPIYPHLKKEQAEKVANTILKSLSS